MHHLPGRLVQIKYLQALFRCGLLRQMHDDPPQRRLRRVHFRAVLPRPDQRHGRAIIDPSRTPFPSTKPDGWKAYFEAKMFDFEVDAGLLALGPPCAMLTEALSLPIVIAEHLPQQASVVHIIGAAPADLVGVRRFARCSVAARFDKAGGLHGRAPSEAGDGEAAAGGWL